MSEIFSEPDDFGPSRASEATTSLGGSLYAQAADTLDPKDSLSGMYIARRLREGVAGGYVPHDWDGVGTPEQQLQLGAIDQAARDAIPDTSIEDAKRRLADEGLTGDVKLPDQPTIKAPVLDLMINEAHDRRDREAAIARGPHGFFPGALGAVTSLGVGMIDPVNIAAFSMPVMGEARMGKIIASAGDSILGRAGVKAGIGAAQGAVGTAVLQPADWWLHTQDGQDYTMAQALQSVVMGAGMGGAFHAAGGVIGDIGNRLRGAPLEGSPQDLLMRGLMTGTHVHADQLAEEGVPIGEVPGMEEVPGIVPRQAPPHPAAAVVDDLPPAAKEDAVHAAMASVIDGAPVRAAEMLDIAADHDPRIAESFEAWHGSPHDFDQFDISRLGTGEGAQAYGHGLYFAENAKVARDYQRTTSDKAFIDKVATLYDEGHSPDDAWGEIQDNWTDFTPGEQQLMTALHKDDWLGFDYPHQAVSAALSRNAAKRWEMSPETVEAVKGVGHMYKVRIGADQDHFLDWDKSFDEQSAHVQNALRNHPDRSVSGLTHKWGHDMASLYSRLSQRVGQHIDENGESWGAQGPSVASKTLREAGIPGIKYLDQGSRGAGDGTRNFVVFDDKHIEITHKNGEAVSIAQLKASPEAVTERAAQPSIPDLVTPPKPRGRTAAHPDTLSLNEHLASQGGLRPDPELKAIYGSDRGPFIPGFGPLIRKSGMSLDDALLSAKQHGYMHDAHDADNGTAGAGGRTSHGLTPNDLLDHLDAENRGQKLYKPTHVEATKYDPEQEKHVILGVLEQQLEASGAKVSDIDPKLLDRTVEIVHREGTSDVMDAYERAIMEDAERYNAIADARKSDPELADIPGFDKPADAGAASRDGGADPQERGQAGRTDQSASQGDGAQSPGNGASPGRSDFAAAANDPRWRQLADVTPDYNEPDVLEESRAADQVPEPASTLVPERSLTALESAAADAEAMWRRIEPSLTEQERALVNNVLDQLNLDKEARDKIITDGVTCLLGAIG